MIEPVLFVVGIIGGWIIGFLVGAAVRDHEYNRIGMKKGKKNHAYTHKRDDWRPGF